jgi:hypothetical protein
MKQIYRRTSRGNFLTLIQGEGLGTGIAIGQLRLVSQNETERLDLKRRAICLEMKQLWSQICACLSLRQYTKTTYGSMRYASKADRARKVSQNKTVHSLAARIMELDRELSQIETAVSKVG